MITCKIKVDVKVNGNIVQQREWPAVDIMKTGVTRAWATRQFNKLWAAREPDQIISVDWFAQYGEEQGNTRLKGSLSGVNALKHKRGIFEDY